MTGSAEPVLAEMRAELAPGERDNRFVPLGATGQASVAAVAALAAEEYHIIPSDRRSFLVLAARSSEPAVGEFFAELAGGENLALATVPALAAASGMDADGLRSYQPQPGCQAYPAYVAWLALNADPADAALALVANFDAWGGYCAALGTALRGIYGYDDQACAFVDFFATPATELAEQALAIAQAQLDAGRSLAAARRHGRALQHFELMFWNTLADGVARP